MGITSVYELPYPDDDDSPNGPDQIEALADKIESTLQGAFEFGAEVEIPGTLDVGGNTVIQGNLNVIGLVDFDHTRMRPRHASDGTDISGVTSGTFAKGSPVCGVTVVIPPSGQLYVTVGGRVNQTQNGNRTVLSMAIMAGGTGGTIELLSPSFSRAVGTSQAVVSDGPAEITASYRHLATGLTPGDTVGVVTMHAVSGGAGLIADRSILVEPVF